MSTREIRIPYRTANGTTSDHVTLGVEVFEEDDYATVIVKIRNDGTHMSCIVRVEDLLAALAESGKHYDG